MPLLISHRRYKAGVAGVAPAIFNGLLLTDRLHGALVAKSRLCCAAKPRQQTFGSHLIRLMRIHQDGGIGMITRVALRD